MKKTILSAVFACLCTMGFAQLMDMPTTSPLLSEPPKAAKSDKVSEVSLLGGIAVSDTEKKYMGEDFDYGGSGFGVGITGLTYVLPYLGAGVDFTYSNTGYGDNITVGAVSNYEMRIEHYTPLVYFKINPLYKSPVRLYIPLGVGVDFASFTTRQLGGLKTKDTQVGLALMAGLGFEVDLGGGSFAGVEGRYNYTDFFDKDSNGTTSLKGYSILFKIGIRFDDNFLM